MTKKLSALLLLTFWLGACASNPSTASVESTQPVGEVIATEAAETSPAESAPTGNSEQAPAGREAVVSDFENEVTVKATSDSEFIPAEKGFVLQQGGSLQTGDSSRARLDLMPEGTIIRVAPNSAFTLPEITETDGAPKTSIQLFFGKIFVLLNGGSLDVQTPSGVASVRGSLLSVSYDPETGRVQAACLEGHCTLENENGEEVELEEGESAYVDEEGNVEELDGIDQDEVQDWLDEAPELDGFLEEVPNPESYPNFEEFDNYEFDPSTYYEEQSTDDGSSQFYDEESLPGTQEPNGEVPTDEPAPGDNSESTPPPTDDGGTGSGG
ncbi:MAG: FecR domain-containing protein [Chloroflexi bacterium]|nr:FecR domain-containing protein [Chloroflexota bacterium]